jgi:hypothetical protein
MQLSAKVIILYESDPPYAAERDFSDVSVTEISDEDMLEGRGNGGLVEDGQSQVKCDTSGDDPFTRATREVARQFSGTFRDGG